MARLCSCCTHPDRDAINEALLKGVLFREIARRYGMHYMSVQRHAKNHLAKRLEEAKMLDLAGIAARFNELDATARDVLAEDRQLSNHKLFWTGVDASSRNLERLYRLTTGAEIEARIAKLEEELNSIHDEPD